MLVNRYRKEQIKKRAIREIENQQPVHSASMPEDDILLVEYQAIVVEAINHLTPRQKEVFTLRTEEDLSLKEIAVTLKISLPAVKKNLYAAIHFMRAHLRERRGWLISLILYVLTHS